MTRFAAILTPKPEEASDENRPAFWVIEASSRADAMRQASDLAGTHMGEADFPYRDRADGSMTILDPVHGAAKIATLRVRTFRASDLDRHAA